MPDIQINELNPTTGVEATDQFATKKGAEDFRTSVQQISDYILQNNLDAQTLLNLILTVDTDGSGLNATTLQGFTPANFRNANNLNAGVVPNARLPQGTFSENFIAGGNWGTGRNNLVLRVPDFIFGIRLMVQVGYSNYIGNNGNIVVSFSQPFSSGFGSDNKPIVLITPECRKDLSGGTPWNGPNSDNPATRNVELDCRLWYSDLTQFRASTIRTGGSENDTARANWIAIGRY